MFGAFRIGMRLMKQIDLISAQDPFETGIVGAKLSFLFRKPLQIQVHTDFKSPYFVKGPWPNVFRRMVAPLVLRSATGIRVVLPRIKENLALLKLRAPISVLPIYVDRHTFGTMTHQNFLRETYPQFRTFIVVVSRLEQEKNVTLAIDAFKSVALSHRETALVIVGSGSELEKLEQHATALGLGAQVIFIGFAADVSPYLLSADIYLHTSWYEGYGMSLVESALAECPIVTTNVGIAGSLLVNNENSIVVAPGDREGLARGLEQLLTDPAIRAVYKKRAKAMVLESLPADFESYLARYKKGFEEALTT
jgi:glycosyltransferase involved in cell wall biosynthesis